MSDKKLYFIALIPPQPIYSDAAGWRAHMAEKYDSKAALRSPPHITLHMPFKWREDKEERIFEVLGNVTAGKETFEMHLSHFGAFKPRVIFINVEENEALTQLHADLKQHMKTGLNLFNAEYKDRGFHPHLTLAFRDLKKSKFFEAWKEFKQKDYKAAFIADNITLLKHNGKSWDEYRTFELK